MTKAEKTKEFIIEKAAPIFNIKGYAGTSLTDLMEATGLTKGAIYGNFTNKDEVAIAVYKYSVDNLNKRISEFLRDKKTPYEQLIGLTDFYRANWKRIFERGGCPVQNASVEADDNLSFLKKHVQASLKNWVASLAKTMERGKAAGEFKTGIDPVEYAYTIITLLEGGIMLSKIMNNQKLLFLALDRIVKIINTEIKK